MKQRILLLILLITPLGGHAFEFDQGQIHGFVSQGYMNSSENNYFGSTRKGTFEFNEAGLNYMVEPCDKLRVGIQIFARQFGEIGDNKVIIDWAYGDYRYRDELGLRGGKFKLPLGFYNQPRDADIARTWILLPQSVYSEANRDLVNAMWGGEIYGNVDFFHCSDIDYEIFIGTPEIDPKEHTIQSLFTGVASGLFHSDIQRENARTKYVAGGAVIWNTPLEGLRVGFSGAKGVIEFEYFFPNEIGGFTPPLGKVFMEGNLALWIASLEWVYGNFTLSAEYLELDLPLQGDVSIVANNGVDFSFTRPQLQTAYYVGGEYLMPCNTTIGAYYSAFYPDRRDKSSSILQYQKEVDLTVRHDINDHWIVKGEVHFINGVGLLMAQDNPDGFKKHWYLYLVKTSYSF